MTMSTKSRREYMNTMRQRYQKTSSRTEKTEIINEVVTIVFIKLSAFTIFIS